MCVNKEAEKAQKKYACICSKRKLSTLTLNKRFCYSYAMLHRDAGALCFASAAVAQLSAVNRQTPAVRQQPVARALSHSFALSHFTVMNAEM